MARVLVVDDDAYIVELMRDILEDAGYSVDTASDGEQALDLVAEAPPDAIVTDLMMPRVDGATLCWQVKGNPMTRSILILLMSASSRLERMVRSCPADAFLAKPFDTDELVSVLDGHLGGAAAPTHAYL